MPTAAAAVVLADGTVAGTVGPIDHPFRLASLTKPLTAWATLIAVEEGTVSLDDPVGQPGCTLRHLLAHAGGYSFDGEEPITRPERRRIYSNTGIEMVAGAVAAASSVPFTDYVREAVFAPLAMGRCELAGSAAHAAVATVGDIAAFLAELQRPSLLAPATAADAVQVHYPDLAGIVPGVGRFDPCPWGLGVEIRGKRVTALDRCDERCRDVWPLRRRRHDDVGRPSGRLRAGGTHRPPVRRLVDRRHALLAGAVRRRARRGLRGRRMSFRLGDRVRWATTGDDGLPLVRYGFVGGSAGDAGPVMVMLDGELGGDVIDLDAARSRCRSPTSSCTSTGPT